MVNIIKRPVQPERGISNKSKNYCTTNTAQRKRILDYLIEHDSLTTTEARFLLDIMHPAGRVLYLRYQGINITTHWEIIDAGMSKHRVARYVLLGLDGGQLR